MKIGKIATVSSIFLMGLYISCSSSDASKEEIEKPEETQNPIEEAADAPHIL